MRIGFIGLGRMGANMVRRLLRDEHQIVAYNRTPEKTKEIEGEGAEAAYSIAELVSKLEKPRAVWIMVPAGDATEAQIEELLEHLEPATRSSTGATRTSTTTSAATPRSRRRASATWTRARRAGSGASRWATALMVGGEDAQVKPLEPVFTSLAPEGGYLHVGGPGAGHYVKMVHNGIEYGLMQAYAEGFEIMHASDYELDLGAISEMWMHGSVVRSWLLELMVRAYKANGQDLDPPQGLGGGLRRGPLDGAGGDRQGRPGAGHHARAAHPAPLPPGRLVRRQGAGRPAQRVRRPRGQVGIRRQASQPHPRGCVVPVPSRSAMTPTNEPLSW